MKKCFGLKACYYAARWCVALVRGGCVGKRSLRVSIQPGTARLFRTSSSMNKCAEVAFLNHSTLQNWHLTIYFKPQSFSERLRDQNQLWGDAEIILPITSSFREHEFPSRFFFSDFALALQSLHDAQCNQGDSCVHDNNTCRHVLHRRNLKQAAAAASFSFSL